MTAGNPRELVLAADEVAERRREHSVEEAPGVHRTVLWEQAGSAAGVFHLEPGATIGEHSHRQHGHHVWVVRGTAEVLGERLRPGSYWFVPAGRSHALRAIGEDPVELFYVYEVETA